LKVKFTVADVKEKEGEEEEEEEEDEVCC